VTQTEPNIILFDGVCKLCQFSVRYVIRHDRIEKFHFAQLQSATGKRLLQKAGLPADYQNGLVYSDGKTFFLDSTAVLKILKELDGIWKLLYVFIFIPKKLRDGLYHFIAGIRYRVFGKYQSCPIPSKELEHRFLE
jgi:predicted DCC family thiol-disulfide oxidoreductase YuxK